MTYDLRTNLSRPFLNNPLLCGMDRSNKALPLLAVGTVTTVDWSDTKRPRLLWISAVNDDVWSSDWNGCHSDAELSSSELKRTGTSFETKQLK